MLQQILKDMYIDPDVLDGLNEEQKKILFVKMRQEQVRRWKEREEKLEREGGGGAKPKTRTGPSKNVTWLLGCDGDVQVNVIGDVDELRSSRLILSSQRSGLHCSMRKQTVLGSNLVNKACSEPVWTGTETISSMPEPGIQLHFKGVSPASEPRQEATPTQGKDEVLAIEPQLPPLQDDCGTGNGTPSNDVFQEEEDSSPMLEAEEDDDNSSSSADETGDLCLHYRPHLRHAGAPLVTDEPQQWQGDGPLSDTNGLRPQVSQEKTIGPLAFTDRLHPQVVQEQEVGPLSNTDGLRPRDSKKTDKGKEPRAGAVLCQVEPDDEAGVPPRGAAMGRGRVAQLMKTFSTPGSPVLPQRPKPPLPNKPAHLLASPSPSLR